MRTCTECGRRMHLTNKGQACLRCRGKYRCTRCGRRHGRESDCDPETYRAHREKETARKRARKQGNKYVRQVALSWERQTPWWQQRMEELARRKAENVPLFEAPLPVGSGPDRCESTAGVQVHRAHGPPETREWCPFLRASEHDEGVHLHDKYHQALEEEEDQEP